MRAFASLVPLAALGATTLAYGQQSHTYPANPAITPFLNYTLITTASTSPFPVSAGVSQVLVCGIGGGGGGGGVSAATAQASGGASGDFLCALYAVTPGVSVSFAIGTGGTGGPNTGGVGNPGSASSFGTLSFAGGPNGKGSISGAGSSITQSVINSARIPTAPSSSVEVIVEVPPTPSGPAGTSAGTSTAGAPSPWGAGGAGVTNGVGTSAASTAYGAGGGGAASTGASGWIGGSGAPGAIVVRW